MAPQKARNDPDMLKIAKIFDFYHEMLILELVYRGSTKDLIPIVLSGMKNSIIKTALISEQLKEQSIRIRILQRKSHECWKN